MAPAPEEPRALRQGLLAALLGTGLFFLLLEVLLRLVGYAPEDTPYGYDPDLLGDFLANKRHTALHPPPADHTPYRFDTNAQGLRADRNYAVPKPAGVRRVLLLGDSFTKGSAFTGDNFSCGGRSWGAIVGHVVGDGVVDLVANSRNDGLG